MGHNHDVARASVSGGEVVIYEQRGRVRLEVRLEGETLWLTLAQMAELFGRDGGDESHRRRAAHRAGRFRS